MAIELKVTGRCKGCPGFDPELNELYGNGEPCETVATCRNLELCQHIERHIVENPYRGPDFTAFEI